MDNYIAFPGLGLEFNVGTGIQITEDYSIKWYGLIICAAFVICVILGMRSCEKRGLSRDDLMDYILITVPSAIIGARLYYVIFSWDTYKDNPIEILYIWKGGLAIYGGIIGAVLAVFIISKVKKHNTIALFDFMLPYICLGQAIGRWGNFFNQEAYGASTTLPWGMTGNIIAREFGDSLVHPTFLYESLWCFIAFAVMVLVRKKLTVPGQMTALYFTLYGAERALVEGLRTDSLMLGNIRVSQLLSVVLCVAGAVMLIYLSVKKKNALDDEVIDDDSSLARLARDMEAKENMTTETGSAEDVSAEKDPAESQKETEQPEETETREEETEV